MTYVDFIGWIAAGLVLASLSMKTMIPLRLFGIASNIAFLTFGFLVASLPIMVLHAILLPFNVYRLVEMRKMIQRVEEAAARENLSVDWLRPFMHSAEMAQGDVLFRKGDVADRLYFVVSGQVKLEEAAITLQASQIFGELALFVRSSKRALTAVCVESGSLLYIDTSTFQQLYLQNPAIGLFVLQLVAKHMSAEDDWIEKKIQSVKRSKTISE